MKHETPFHGEEYKQAKEKAISKVGQGERGVNLEYFREARFFLGKNSATLTFFDNNEVASIHYDRSRDEIFYKGHNVKNMTLTKEQWTFLHKFADFLIQTPTSKKLYDAYLFCLDQLMLRQMKKP